MEFNYRYMDISWKVDFAKHTKELIDPLFSDYYNQCDLDELFSIKLISESYKDVKEILEFGTKIIIHNSKKSSVHEEGLCFCNGFSTHIYNLSTKSVYHINYLTNKVTIFNNDVSMLARDAIRVIRDLVKALVEDRKKAVMYHAAALKGPCSQGIILLGGKGSGKTTFSLKLLYEQGFTEVSRDRVFVESAANKTILHGWPNYYNLTMRTLKSFKETEKYLPKKYSGFPDEELENLSEKSQMLPKDMGIEKKVQQCDLTHVIFLVNENKKSASDMWDLLAYNCYSPNDLNYPDWHGWVREKRHIYSNAKDISQKLIGSNKMMILGWNSIEEGIDKILEFIGGF